MRPCPHRIRSLPLIAFSLWILFHPGIAETADYLAVDGPCDLVFPDAHGPHPGYRTEWWYYTGNVKTGTGRCFGYQLTFFRRQIVPPGAETAWPSPRSSWRTQQIYMAHAAVSDIHGNRHLFDERIAREALGLAGSGNEAETTGIFLGNWSARISADRHRLNASAGDFDFDFTLKPVKPPVLHGEAGYSRKGTEPRRASCYYSFTRLETAGVLELGGESFRVTGLSWMDHEFSTALLEPDTAGWDWFSLQLSDRTELMVFLLRREDGTMGPASSGTFVDAAGNTRHLGKNDFRLSVRNRWESPHSGAEYPVEWKLTIHTLSLELAVSAALPEQEMRTTGTTGITYWEGSVTARGTSDGRPVTGAGYVELTGYAGKFSAPL